MEAVHVYIYVPFYIYPYMRFIPILATTNRSSPLRRLSHQTCPKDIATTPNQPTTKKTILTHTTTDTTNMIHRTKPIRSNQLDSTWQQ